MSLRTSSGAGGHWAGTAVIRNTNAATRSTGFVITLMRGAKQVATLTGSANGVAGGRSTTVALASKDAFTTGAVSYRFQTGFGF